jgi:hypothetical protein
VLAVNAFTDTDDDTKHQPYTRPSNKRIFVFVSTDLTPCNGNITVPYFHPNFQTGRHHFFFGRTTLQCIYSTVRSFQLGSFSSASLRLVALQKASTGSIPFIIRGDLLWIELVGAARYCCVLLAGGR